MLNRRAFKCLAARVLETCKIDLSIAALRSRMSPAPAVTILMYHRILPESAKSLCLSPQGILVSQENFERQIAFLSSHYTIISMDDYVTARLLHRRVPKRSIILTFDDGYEDNFTYAFPILKSFRLPAIIYLSTDYIGDQKLFWQQKINHLIREWRGRPNPKDIIKNVTSLTQIQKTANQVLKNPENRIAMFELIKNIKRLSCEERQDFLKNFETHLGLTHYPIEHDRFLTWEAVLEMAQHGISFGSHTASHSILTTLKPDHVSQELETSLEVISQHLGFSAYHFSYPNGSFNAGIKEMVQKKGYLSALSTDSGLNDGKTDLFALKRIHIHDRKTADSSGRFSLSLFRSYVANLL